MKRTRGFTLVEILIVLAIIGILMAILFPVIKRTRENGNQANCRTNLHQIGLAVAMYQNDEKAYPGSLAFLLPTDFSLSDAAGVAVPGSNANGAGWLKSSRNLMCPDDDNDSVIRSSYGDISVARPSTPAYDPASYENPTHDPSEMSRYVWNYYGYDNHGTSFSTAAEAATWTTTNNNALLSPSNAYNERTNPIKYSLSNRYAPPSTIVTHCIFHRTQTANAADATLTSDDAAHIANAKDIVLRLDGAARVVDISNYASLGGGWTTQTD